MQAWERKKSFQIRKKEKHVEFIIILYFITQFIMDFEQESKYASVLREVNIPEVRHLDPTESRLVFTLLELFIVEQSNMIQKQYPNVSANVQDATKKLIDTAESQFTLFKNPEDYVFRFPESKFPDVPRGETNKISYEQKKIVEDQDTFKDRLSAEQIKQIAEKGEFQVKSSLPNVAIPYVWRINNMLFVGKTNMINIWNRGLATCYQLLVSGFTTIQQQIPKQFFGLTKIPGRLFSLIFGRRKLTVMYTPNYARQVQKDFWQDIMNNELKNETEILGSDFWKHLYVPFESRLYENIRDIDPKKQEDLRKVQSVQRKQYEDKVTQRDDVRQKLLDVQNQFERNWAKIKKRVLQRASEGMDDEEYVSHDNKKENLQEQAILEKFEEEKFSIYLAHLKEHLPRKNLSTSVIEALVILIHIVRIMEAKISLNRQAITDAETKISEKIKKKYKIRSFYWKFYRQKLKEEFDPVRDAINQEFNATYLEDKKLSNYLPEKYHSIIKKYFIFQKEYDNKVEQKKKTLKIIYTPSRVFYTTYRLLPPYQIVKEGDKNFHRMIKSKEMTIDTSTDFWKFKLYAMRMKSWTINCLVTLFGLSWVGPFGLRCLFGLQQFNVDEYCDIYTGERMYNKQKPFLKVFMTVLSGVKKSREHFEALPDRGLLGKNLSRWLNYIQCYLFRFLLVGVLGVLIIYPILIVVLSLLCFVLIVTFWAWVPLVMIVCYLFNILVFQFESSYIPHGILIRSIPLLSLVMVLLKVVFASFFILLWGLILSPILCALYSVFLVIQRAFRTVTDGFMLFVFAKLGRTPSRDTAIAKKISGPGMSRSYFTSINEDDVYVLTQAELERLFFEEYARKTREKIENTSKKYNQTMNFILKPFGYPYPINDNQNLINNNKQTLLNQFNSQCLYYKARYPTYPSQVRFTKEQIDNYFENSTLIVKNFVERKEIQGWIFENSHILNGDYDELARHVWINVFRCGEGIFEPLQKIDSRFTLEDMGVSNHSKMRKKVGSVMTALEGQITLNKERVRFSPAKRSLLTKDQTFQFLSSICMIHKGNSERNVYAVPGSPINALCPHLNLQQLKKHDEYQRREYEQKYERIIIE